MFDKVHQVYEGRGTGSVRRLGSSPIRRGPHLHTGYVPGPGRTRVRPGLRPLYQLLVLLERSPVLEEFNQLKTIDLAVTNDRMWAHV